MPALVGIMTDDRQETFQCANPGMVCKERRKYNRTWMVFCMQFIRQETGGSRVSADMQLTFGD